MSRNLGCIVLYVSLLSIFCIIRKLAINVYLLDETATSQQTKDHSKGTSETTIRAILKIADEEESSSGSLTSSNVNSSFGSINNRAVNVTTYPIASRQHSRVLAGIFSGDFIDDSRYRYAFRELFQTHPKVCSLVDFIAIEKVQTGPCELIYTFVLGGNVDENAPTQIVSNTSTIPILAPKKPKSVHSNDFHEGDITFLNIKENMNQGKSPTWFYYAGTLLDAYKLDYVMKMDTDSLLYLDRYFNFSRSSLPPAPYNTRIIAGLPVDKLWWHMKDDHKHKTEPYFVSHYSSLHLFATGQMYIFSPDLADGVAHVAAYDKDMINFAEGYEDHDITTMAFLALKHGEKDNPIKFIIIPFKDPFWKHPLKLRFGVSKWKQTWDTEIARMRSLTQSDLKPATSVRTFGNSLLARDKSTRATSTISDVPVYEVNEQSAWIKYIEQNNTEMLEDSLKVLDAVQINNSIAPSRYCFLNTGYLQGPLKVVQLTGPYEGGKNWDTLATFFKQRFSTGTDVIILNGVDVGMARSDNIHIVQKLAETLQMNFAWAASEIQLLLSTPANYHGYSGPAILSKCPMHDPYLVRELHNQDSMSKTKVIRSNYGMFVRIASTETIASGVGNHIVVGSVSKLDQWKKRHMIWEYQFGYWPTDLRTGISPSNQIGSIIAGEMEANTCSQLGLKQIDPRNHSTFPASCRSTTNGNAHVDNVCSNLMLAPQKFIQALKPYASYLPCIRLEQSNKGSNIQISQHSVVFTALH